MILLCGGHFRSHVGLLESLWATAGSWHHLSQARSFLLWPVTARSSSDFPIQHGVGGALEPRECQSPRRWVRLRMLGATLRLFRHLSSSSVPDPLMCFAVSRHVWVHYPGTGLSGQQGRATPHFTDGVFEACPGHAAGKLWVPHTVLILVIYLPEAPERAWLGSLQKLQLEAQSPSFSVHWSLARPWTPSLLQTRSRRVLKLLCNQQGRPAPFLVFGARKG